jgi:dTDP-4-amino-4,6-dideoxygalactose transaminase
MIPYGRQLNDEDDINEVINVLKSDYLTQGVKIPEFEKALCEYTGAKYCVALSSGTAALHLAVASLDIDIGKDGITTPNTFVASANCLIYNGLKPVFADIDERTYNINVEEIKGKINENTRVIIPVDFAGQPAI